MLDSVSASTARGGHPVLPFEDMRMKYSRLSLRLVLVYAVSNLTLAIAYVQLAAVWHKDEVVNQVEKRLNDTAVVLRSHVAELVANGDEHSLQRLVKELTVRTADRGDAIRITVVNGEGKVLADSHERPDRMKNHRLPPPYARQELDDAWANGFGKAQRYSDTLRINMFYLALPVDNGGDKATLARVAVPVESIEEQVGALTRVLWGSAGIAGILALGLTLIIGARIMKPLSELTGAAEAVAAGHYDQHIPAGGHDELDTLARAVDDMRRALTRQMSELRENSQRLETVLSSMEEGVLAVDPDQRVLFANQAGRTLLGIETSEVVERPLLEVTRHLAVREAVIAAMHQAHPHELEFETTGVNRRHLALRAIQLPGDPCPGVVIVLYDITNVRKLEDLRREFAANVSHELKTPLSSIKAYAETLRLGAINDVENNLAFVERIEEQAERLHQLILDLLQLARVESGKETFDIGDVALNGVLDRCLPAFWERIEAKQLHVAVDREDGPVLAQADEEGVVTILDNLVSNAIQYTPEGGDVTIRCRLEEDAAVLEVEDTGIGIAPADQERVFERFYRVDKARSCELGGTGLGLAIVKHLTQAFGGEVGLDSELGKGSTFRIRLPLADT